ncbi:MAG: HAMP domain-containing histidine kinase [Lachnospiraceae bacterium]|nr:HAMP domain-containing histidine kinase [Lachnospiraceae bacterium]
MGTVKNKWLNLSLRRFLMATVFTSFGIVVIVSALIIAGCASFRHWLLPDYDMAYLTIEKTMSDGSAINSTVLLEYGQDMSSIPSIVAEDDDAPEQMTSVGERYSLQKIERSMDSLTPKRKLAYKVCGFTMFAAPTILAFTAIFFCSIVFYRCKLKEPLALMAEATGQIAARNLDFAIKYDSPDEMGDLCRSFENMRAALYENNKDMWNMLEERRLMQASVAHDLRNPIAIIQGYTEYMQKGLDSGGLDSEKTARIVKNLGVAAKRLEQYTESVRLLNQSEEIQTERKAVSALKLAESISDDLSLMAENCEIRLQVTNHLPDEEIMVDSALLYRVLENIVNNSLRYANRVICIHFTLEEGFLSVEVKDDGAGFPPDILTGKSKNLLVAGEDGHMGIGLSISRLLCQKHGGSLEMSNTAGGARVKISLSV